MFPSSKLCDMTDHEVWRCALQGVLRELSATFQTKASDLLDTLRKTESSLNRIRHSRTMEQTAAGGMTDIQKISMQLFLDVQVEYLMNRPLQNIPVLESWRSCENEYLHYAIPPLVVCRSAGELAFQEQATI